MTLRLTWYAPSSQSTSSVAQTSTRRSKAIKVPTPANPACALFACRLCSAATFITETSCVKPGSMQARYRNFCYVDHPDLFVTQTIPPLAVPLVAVAARLWRRPCMIIAMDVYSEVLEAHGVITRQSVAGRFLARLFSWTYRSAERVVTLGPVMSTRPRSKGGHG